MRVMTKEFTPGKPTTRRYAKQEKDQAVSLVFGLRKALGTSQITVIRIADQLQYGTESLRRWVAEAEVDAGDVSDWECRLGPQDALRTRFIENWCKVVQTVEHSKPLLRLGSRVYPLVRGLWCDGLLIRRLHVQVVPGVLMGVISMRRCGRSSQS